MKVAVKKKRGVGGIVAAPVILFIIFFLVLAFNVVVIGAIGGVVGLGVGGYFLVRDTRTEEVQYDENFDIKAFGENVLLSSIDNTEQKKKIEVVVTKDDVNNLLYKATSSLNIQDLTKGIINKAYINIEGNDYHFYIDVDAKVIKTRVHLTTTLYEKYSTNSFVFKIKDISFGNLSGLKGVTKKILNRFVTEEMVNQFIEGTKLSLKYNAKNLSITYAKEDILKDISAMTGNNNGMYMDVVQAMIKQELINFNLASDNFIEGYVDLTKLHTNEYVTDDPGQIVVNSHDVVTNCKEKTLELIRTNPTFVNSTPSTEVLTAIFKYLFLGYDGSDASVKSIIDSIDFSYIGITDKTTYKGFDLVTDEQHLINRMSSTINPNAIMYGGTDICRLTETDITEYVRGRSVVGYTTLITRTDPSTGELKLNFVTIDNFYCNLYQDPDNNNKATADFIVKINLNGYPTSLAFSALFPSKTLNDNKLTFTVKDIKYGEMGGEDLTNLLFEIIASALSGGDSSISANKEDHTISFNFTEIINSAKQQVETEVRKIPEKESWSGDDVFKGENISLEMFGAGKHDEGQFGIILKEPVTL